MAERQRGRHGVWGWAEANERAPRNRHAASPRPGRHLKACMWDVELLVFGGGHAVASAHAEGCLWGTPLPWQPAAHPESHSCDHALHAREMAAQARRAQEALDTAQRRVQELDSDVRTLRDAKYQLDAQVRHVMLPDLV